MSLTEIATLIGLATAIVALTFSAIELHQLRKEVRRQAETSVYSAAFEWDRFLLDHPDLAKLLANPSSEGGLTAIERVLASYRLDLAEFTYYQAKSRVYKPEHDFFQRLVAIPLIKEAIHDQLIAAGLKYEFFTQLKSASLRRGSPA